MDKPFNFYRPIILPPDPMPRIDPRPEAFDAEMGPMPREFSPSLGFITDEDTGDFLIDEDTGADLVPEGAGPPPPDLLVDEGTGDILIDESGGGELSP